jgi:hypothetical protein
MPSFASSLSNSDKIAELMLILGSPLAEDGAAAVAAELTSVGAGEEVVEDGLVQLFRPTTTQTIARAVKK